MIKEEKKQRKLRKEEARGKRMRKFQYANLVLLVVFILIAAIYDFEKGMWTTITFFSGGLYSFFGIYAYVENDSAE